LATYLHSSITNGSYGLFACTHALPYWGSGGHISGITDISFLIYSEILNITVYAETTNLNSDESVGVILMYVM
jgi:uncharacterized membrane protein